MKTLATLMVNRLSFSSGKFEITMQPTHFFACLAGRVKIFSEKNLELGTYRNGNKIFRASLSLAILAGLANFTNS